MGEGMQLATAISILISVTALAVAILSAHYTRRQSKAADRQVKIMEDDVAERKERDDEDESWAQRYEDLQRKLTRINPRTQVLEPENGNNTWIYSTMYADPKFRANVERFIVELDASQTLFLPRKPQPYELRSTTMRETIQRAESELARFIKEHPFCKQHLCG
jgi:hypothetical protein